MTRFVVPTGALLIMSMVQSVQPAPIVANCAQIRQAVATYGYAAARRYALAHYGTEAVKYGQRCLAKKNT